MKTNEILLQIITLIHILFILFVILVPFLGSNYFMMLHVIIIPFIILHWIVNDNTCFLTVVEKKLRKEVNGSEGDCITCKLIEPVYDFKKNFQTFSMIIYSIAITLWLISVGRLYYRYHKGIITSFSDLFIL